MKKILIVPLGLLLLSSFAFADSMPGPSPFLSNYPMIVGILVFLLIIIVGMIFLRKKKK